MKLSFEQIPGGVVAAEGFQTGGVFCDIKRLGTGKGSNKGPKRDLALLVSDVPCSVGGMFTTNQVCAAPVKVCVARVALARLDYAEALRFTEGLKGSDARQIRGRAFWYQGDLEQAADELEALLRDPQIKDPWAREVSKLARQSQGRRPFAIEGGVVAMIEMPPTGPALVVPCELEGEQVLALVATAVGELVVDSNTRREPAWVNLRFGDRIEVKDVPALTQDLSPLARQFGAPIKALLGVNLLRHMHVTFDRRGSQFVVRQAEPPAPPDATRVPLFYVRGGGMMVRGNVTTKDDQQSPFLVDSTAFYPIALDDALWKRSGANLASLKVDPQGLPNTKMGELPLFRFGGFDLPQVPALQGVPINDARTALADRSRADQVRCGAHRRADASNGLHPPRRSRHDPRRCG